MRAFAPKPRQAELEPELVEAMVADGQSGCFGGAAPDFGECSAELSRIPDEATPRFTLELDS